MLYYYSGTESYLKKSALKKICDTISHPELNTAEFWEASPKLYSFIDTFPFVGGKKVCILHYFPDDKAFLEISRKMPDFTDVYIAVSSYPDKRKKIVKEILELAQEKEFKKDRRPEIDAIHPERTEKLWIHTGGNGRNKGRTGKSVPSLCDACGYGFGMRAKTYQADCLQRQFDKRAYTGIWTGWLRSKGL